MKSWTLEILAWFVAVALIGGCVAKARAERVDVPDEQTARAGEQP